MQLPKTPPIKNPPYSVDFSVDFLKIHQLKIHCESWVPKMRPDLSKSTARVWKSTAKNPPTGGCEKKSTVEQIHGRSGFLNLHQKSGFLNLHQKIHSQIWLFQEACFLTPELPKSGIRLVGKSIRRSVGRSDGRRGSAGLSVNHVPGGPGGYWILWLRLAMPGDY